MVEINQAVIDSLVMLDLELSMHYINVFFVIVSLQVSHLFYELRRERNER